MDKIIRAMMSLIACEVFGKALDKTQCELSDDEMLTLYKLSKSHDLAHIVGDALTKNDLITNDEVRAKFRKQSMLAVYRYEKMVYELGRLRKTLNEAKIPFVPLKGSVLRRYYPEPAMRTSCDIDILVPDKRADEAAKLIVDLLGYTYESKYYHDISLISGSGIHLELHHSLKEDQPNIDALLSECWDYADVSEEYEYSFTPEYFLFHQYAHASHHFIYGGCGVRPFIDIYLLDRKLEFDRDVLGRMLSRTGIKTFADAALRLAEVWFGDGEHDEVTRSMEHFVLIGGVYGSTENTMAVRQQKEKGRLGYILSSIWMPYHMLSIKYPSLRGRRYLQPYYEIKRWFRLFKPDVRARKTRDLRVISELSDSTISDVNRMLRQLDLL